MAGVPCALAAAQSESKGTKVRSLEKPALFSIRVNVTIFGRTEVGLKCELSTQD